MNARIVTLALCLSLPLSLASGAPGGKTERVSVDSHENPTPSGLSDSSSISANGRFAAFDSAATTLVPHDTNGEFDVFLRDRATGKTTRISVASNGDESVGGDSYAPSVSGNGRFIAFESQATNLVSHDTNQENDVFVHDRVTGKTERISVATDGTEGNGESRSPSISANGRFVAFQSYADNLVEGDENNATDIFVRDRKKKTTVRVSLRTDGGEANHESFHPSISAKGRSIVFESRASNLAASDANDKLDVFLHDAKTGETICLSLDTTGTQTGDKDSYHPMISANGRVVAFASQATNLVATGGNSQADVFTFDRKTGIRARQSLTTLGTEITDAHCGEPSLSRNGRYLVFTSPSEQIVDSDTNHSTDVFVRDCKTGKTTRASLSVTGAESTNPDAYYPTIAGGGKYAIFTSNATDLDQAGDANNTGDIFVRKLR